AGARVAYERAIDSGHDDKNSAPRAALMLGAVLQQQDDFAGARRALQQAISSGHPDAAPMAARSLATLLEQHGDFAGARRALEQAIDSGHPDEAPMAALALGALLERQKDLVGARVAYQQAIDSGHPEASAQAQAALGVNQVAPQDEDLPAELARGSATLELRGMQLRYKRLRGEQLGGLPASHLLDCLKLLHEAGQAPLDEPLTRAVAEQICGDGPIATETWEGLCRRTQEEGFGAFTANEFRTDSAYLEECVEYTPTSAELDCLLTLLSERGEWERVVALAFARALREEADDSADEMIGAVNALKTAMDSGDADQAPVAALTLGSMLDDTNFVLARDAYEQALKSGHPDVAPVAALNLAKLLYKQGDFAGARAVVEPVIDSRHPDYASEAAFVLGSWLQQQGDVAGANAAFEKAISPSDRGQSPWAAIALGFLLKDKGDFVGAQRAFQRAIESGKDSAPMAGMALGVMRQEQGDFVGAQRAYEQVS
ncbi:MAG: tetratricopeptide repeat protein, partial [Gammaproteobacteria bacterium]